jgi:hypothetical protein
MTYLDAERPVTFQPHEAEELYWLLSRLEDWLLHASDAAVDELGDFVNHHYPRGAVAHVIDTLGHYSVELRRRGEGHQP